jgi:hypothetical protein
MTEEAGKKGTQCYGDKRESWHIAGMTSVSPGIHQRINN